MTDEQCESLLRGAFAANRSGKIVVRSRKQQVAIELIAYAQERGWMDEVREVGDEQNSVWVAKLNAAGRKHFGLEEE